MARQMAKATAGADKTPRTGTPRTGSVGPGLAAKAKEGTASGSGAGGAGLQRVKAAGQAKVAGQVKPVLAKKPTSKPKSAPAVGLTPEALAKQNRDAQFRALVDPAAQEARKKQHLEAFKKLQAMSMEDLQVEFIVCIRAEHYKDALMYSEIMMEKDPTNALVMQFQPLLASMAVQANERLCESSDSDSDDSDGEGGDDENNNDDGADAADGTNGAEEEESDSDSDDPETAWMWSETWRTDPDDEDDATNGKSEPAPAK